MQPWQIKALELEASALKHLDGFIHEHALYFFIGAVYLLLALLAWVLRGALRRKGGKSKHHVRPAIFIDLTGRSPTPRTHLTHSRHIGNHRIATAMTIITTDPGRRAAARSFRATSSPRRRSLLRNGLARPHAVWNCRARLRAFLLRQCR